MSDGGQEDCVDAVTWRSVSAGLMVLLVAAYIETERRFGGLAYGEVPVVVAGLGVGLLAVAVVGHFVRPFERVGAALDSGEGE